MCTNFAGTRNEAWVKKTLGVGLPLELGRLEVFPGYLALVAMLDASRQSAEINSARFGLIPNWAKDAAIGRKTYNCRSETVAEKPSYRTPWRKRQFAIALMDHFYEPNWETGKAERWQICRRDGEPMGVACIWDRWIEPLTGEVVTSFSMLTVNADGHPVMGRFHRPGDEKRSVVLLPTDRFNDWLHASVEEAQNMIVVPAPGLLECAWAPRQPAKMGLFD